MTLSQTSLLTDPGQIDPVHVCLNICMALSTCIGYSIICVGYGKKRGRAYPEVLRIQIPL